MALALEEIGTVEAAGFCFDEDFVAGGLGVGTVLELEDVGVARSGDNYCLHAAYDLRLAFLG